LKRAFLGENRTGQIAVPLLLTVLGEMLKAAAAGDAADFKSLLLRSL
jgi:hypothetical protein